MPMVLELDNKQPDRCPNIFGCSVRIEILRFFSMRTFHKVFYSIPRWKKKNLNQNHTLALSLNLKM